MVSVPLTTTFVYLLAVFSFGFSGDLAARHSMYPVRMFTLPVTNAALVGWPMFYGTAAMAILWLAVRLYAVWPSGIEIPLIDRKSTRLNSSHGYISYAVFCLKKKNKKRRKKVYEIRRRQFTITVLTCKERKLIPINRW